MITLMIIIPITSFKFRKGDNLRPFNSEVILPPKKIRIYQKEKKNEWKFKKVIIGDNADDNDNTSAHFDSDSEMTERTDVTW